MEDLLHSLNVPKLELSSPHFTTLDSLQLRAEVEYLKCGCRIVGSSARQLMTLDLSVGQKVKIVTNHSHVSLDREDSPSVNDSHKSKNMRPNEVKEGRSRRRPRLCDLMSGAGRPPAAGHRVGEVRGVSTSMEALVIRAGGEELRLGLWWLEDMRAGLVENIPVVNISPRMSPRTGCGVCQREN